MILRLDSTDSKNIIVELLNSKVEKIDELCEQRLGSQILLPMIVKILQKNKKAMKDIKSIQINPGPGSFTGTRVGVSIANALAFALDLKVNDKKAVLPQYEKSKFDDNL